MTVSRMGMALVIVVGLAGCKSCDENAGGTGPTASTTASAAPSASASVAASASASGRPDRRAMWAGGGPTGALFAAADEADLKPEQKTKIEEIRKGLHGDGSSMRDEAKGFRDELETQVKAGKIEMAKLEPHLAAIEKAQKERLEKEDEALNKLYAALEPAQRTAVVAKVKAKAAERAERMAKRASHDKPDGKLRPSPIGRMTRNLDLDDAQKKKVEALAAKHTPDGGAPMGGMFDNDKRLTAIAAAFEKEGFDAKKIEPVDAKKARAPFEAQAKLYADLLPILQPPQREKLASAMDKRGGHGSGRHGHHGRPSASGGGGGGDHDDDDDDDK